MNRQTRRLARGITAHTVPISPGVYAWYRDGRAVYVGRATGSRGLRGRVWSNHLQTGTDLSRSSHRRNVCEYLGIAPTKTTSVRPTIMTASDVAPVNFWIGECETAWIVCASESEAKQLENGLKAEWMPPLSRW